MAFPEGDSGWGVPLWARFAGSNRGLEERSPVKAWIRPEGAASPKPPEGAPADCPLPYDWETRRYAALDVETTGLDSRRDHVVELAVLPFHFDEEGALVEEEGFCSFINPAVSIPESSIAIHGITDLDVSAAPFFGEIVGKLTSILAGRVIVAHNAPFDEGFIKAEFSRARALSPLEEIADSLVLARMAFPGLHSYALGKAAFLLGIDSGSSHRAFDDARTCMLLFSRSARILAGACT
ncbi:MAG: 3'-5' exonuclease [Spirochaetes bacterium]|nr:3'-5' exonuclease [Spirochaetota bacterium]